MLRSQLERLDVRMYARMNGRVNRDDTTPFSSEFMYDVTKRNKVPFSGITTNVHLNCRVDLADVITELCAYPGIYCTQLLFSSYCKYIYV